MRSFRLKLSGIAIFGVAARTLLMMTTTRFRNLGFDAAFYDLLAKALARGHGFVNPFALYSGNGSRPSALFPPGYSIFLALFAPFGAQSHQWHLFVGRSLGGVSIVLSGYLARHFLSDPASLVVAALAAVYPMVLGSDTSGMPEALYLPLILATLLLAMKCTSRQAWPWVLMGITIGYAALTRGEALLYLPLLVLPVAICTDGSALRKAALIGLTTMIAIVVLAPWAIRNELTFGSPVLLANSSATVVGGANCYPAYHGKYLGAWVYDCLNAHRQGAGR